MIIIIITSFSNTGVAPQGTIIAIMNNYYLFELIINIIHNQKEVSYDHQLNVNKHSSLTWPPSNSEYRRPKVAWLASLRLIRRSVHQ